jgi:periplasmic protein TonB
MRHMRLISAVGFLALCIQPAHGQTIGGRVLGDSSKHAIAGVRVALVDSASGQVIDSTVTDTSGIFYATAGRNGTFFVRFERAGAVPRFSPRYRLTGDAFQQGTFLLPEGIERTAYASADVDVKAAPVARNPGPRYPRGLRNRGINGNVRIQFIVDTTGLAVLASLRILTATAPEFADAVRDVIGQWKFYPGKRGGVPVRVLVCMPLSFRVSGGANERQLDAEFASWQQHPECPSS